MGANTFIWLWVILGLGIIGYLWFTGHPYLIDTGDGPGNKRAFWNMHSASHITGAAVAAFFPAIAGGGWRGFYLGVGIALLFGIAIELGQRFPRKGGVGVIEWPDVFWDLVGGVGGALLGSVIGHFLGF